MSKVLGFFGLGLIVGAIAFFAASMSYPKGTPTHGALGVVSIVFSVTACLFIIASFAMQMRRG